jgi:hypothetical protein
MLLCVILHGMGAHRRWDLFAAEIEALSSVALITVRLLRCTPGSLYMRYLYGVSMLGLARSRPLDDLSREPTLDVHLV